MQNWKQNEQTNIDELIQIVHLFHERGHSPATSTNYSLRLNQDPHKFIISKSGIDKSKFDQQSLMLIDNQGHSVLDETLKSSAETFIHLVIYEHFKKANAVLHTHSLGASLLSMKSEQNTLAFSDLEILKGLEGNTTHEMTEIVPIFENAQDIKKLSVKISDYFNKNSNLHGLILKGHGLYTWGDNLAMAKRHIETFEYLFQYKLYEQKFLKL